MKKLYIYIYICQGYFKKRIILTVKALLTNLSTYFKTKIKQNNLRINSTSKNFAEKFF